ncbi:MAG: 3-isopropylmalate dehydratase large subunit [Clostridiales Family XIII bacterium]|jgi:3-isopropylmalate/(R)-2-methylmalate dehydratase large subunit|nr:3-isopropylmalate dehydratase large subunit [Clostridiales Family XIII bacterium]
MGGHTATEKILAKKSGNKEVFPGDAVICDLDLVYHHSPWLAIPLFDEIGEVGSVFDGDKVTFGLGHHVCLPSTQEYATFLKQSREWAKKYGIRHVYDMGTGNSHLLMLEKGHVFPGALCVGGDSHATVYGVLGAFGTAITYEVADAMLSGKTWFRVPATVRIRLEGATQRGVCARDVGQHLVGDVVGADGALWKTIDYTGSYIDSLSIMQRSILSFLAVEMGGVTGFMEPDRKTFEYIRNRVHVPYEAEYNDSDCAFEKEWHVDVSKIEPLVGCPPRPSNNKPISEVEGVKIDQAYIGGCTGSSTEDFRMAAEILKGRSIHPDTRLIIVPGTQEILAEMRQEGLLQFFEDIGAIISAPYCGPCQMMCYGFLGEGETMIGTHPRNLPGRAGVNVNIFLSSPYTVAAAAANGRIVDPRVML